MGVLLRARYIPVSDELLSSVRIKCWELAQPRAVFHERLQGKTVGDRIYALCIDELYKLVFFFFLEEKEIVTDKVLHFKKKKKKGNTSKVGKKKQLLLSPVINWIDV